jgi:hypothetical protein
VAHCFRDRPSIIGVARRYSGACGIDQQRVRKVDISD